MSLLKKWFPISFSRSKSVVDMIIGIILYILIGIVAGLLIWVATLLTGWIPAVGGIIAWLLGIVSTIVEVWVVAGIIVLILAFFKILK